MYAFEYWSGTEYTWSYVWWSLALKEMSADGGKDSRALPTSAWLWRVAVVVRRGRDGSKMVRC